ncbi:unnamed protein product, partial [Symbiodinium sp. CCMP2456]
MRGLAVASRAARGSQRRLMGLQAGGQSASLASMPDRNAASTLWDATASARHGPMTNVTNGTLFYIPVTQAGRLPCFSAPP